MVSVGFYTLNGITIPSFCFEMIGSSGREEWEVVFFWMPNKFYQKQMIIQFPDSCLDFQIPCPEAYVTTDFDTLDSSFFFSMIFTGLPGYQFGPLFHIFGMHLLFFPSLFFFFFLAFSFCEFIVFSVPVSIVIFSLQPNTVQCPVSVRDIFSPDSSFFQDIGNVKFLIYFIILFMYLTLRVYAHSVSLDMLGSQSLCLNLSGF